MDVHICVYVCICVHTTVPGWWRVPSYSHALFCKMSNPSSDGDQRARLWFLPELLSPFDNPSHGKLGLWWKQDCGEMCKVRAGLTPFCISFKIGSEPISIQSYFSEVFNLFPYKFANLSPEVVLGPSLPSSITDWPRTWRRPLSLIATGLGPPNGPVQPASGLCPKTLSIPSPTFLLPLAPIKKWIGGQGGEKGDQERKPNSPFESGFFELCVWGKFLWILIWIYIPHVLGIWRIYICIYIS